MMIRSTLAICLIWLIAISNSAAQSLPSHDLAGTHDNPIVSRFSGSVIIGYHSADYDQLLLPLGPMPDQQFTRTANAEGRLTQIAYAAPMGKTALEVLRNYQSALRNAGFTSSFVCGGNSGPRACGNESNAAQAIASEALIHTLSQQTDLTNLMISTLWPTDGHSYVQTAHLDRNGAPVDVVLLVTQATSASPAGVLLQICEGKSMATQEVSVNAKAMSDGLTQNGHIALYGLHFASDSANINADSAPTLSEMVTLLKSQPKLNVFIVGHTDNSGSLSHNLALSQKRAEMVVQALVSRGISQQRVVAKGLASYAPVASNLDEAGKAKNRRVELVAQ